MKPTIMDVPNRRYINQIMIDYEAGRIDMEQMLAQLDSVEATNEECEVVEMEREARARKGSGEE